MNHPCVFSFPPFRLDGLEGRLYRDTKAIPLRPKTFALLQYLAMHAGELVTKETLLSSLWTKTVVSESGLTEVVRELRKALHDNPKTPRFIETVHGRGYRFIGEVVTSQHSGDRSARAKTHKPSSLAQDSSLRVQPLVLVGREQELAQLHEWLAKMLSGERQVVFVTGEPGIGKTSLVNAFLQTLDSGRQTLDAHPWISHGQCIEQYGASEAYLPVLAALGRLARQAGNKHVASVLRQYAPTWLAQMPALLAPREFAELQRRVLGSTRERMLREMAEALEVLTSKRPLVLVLEDLHWSDYSTLDLLSFVAQRQEPARLLVMATYRPVEVFSRQHPLKNVKQELHARGQCVELPLACLSESAVTEYLEKRFVEAGDGRHLFPELAHVIYGRTDGHPLFMVNVAEYMAARNFSGARESVEQRIPHNVRQMIEKQIDRLGAADQRLLEVASVAGAEFSAASVAAGLAMDDVDAVEQSCSELARRAQFLQLTGKSLWPDGTVAARYGFLHALYQNVLYGRVTPGRRARLHRRIGEREERGYGEQGAEAASELAVHFEEGQDYPRALRYLKLAGESAIRRCANREAIELFTKGLALLKLLPQASERAQHELALHIALGAPLIHLKGYAAEEVGRVYRRARELYPQAGEPAQLFSVLWGLWLYHVVRAEHHVAYEIGEQLRELERNEPIAFPLAHYAPGVSLFWLGDIVRTRAYLEQGLARYDPQAHGTHIFSYSQDPKVVSLSYQAWTLWFLGYPDQALRCSNEAIAWAQELAHPFSLAFAWGFASEAPRLRRDATLTQKRAEAAVAIGKEQGFPFWVAWGAMLRGWAFAEQGRPTDGIAAIRAGLAAYEATGATMGKTWFLSHLAEAYGKAGQPEAGLCALSDAFAFLDKTNERAYEAELWRVKGELLQRAKQPSKSNERKL